jgi:hypothetical protein
MKDIIIPEHSQNLQQSLELELGEVIGSLSPMRIEWPLIVNQCLRTSISKAMRVLLDKVSPVTGGDLSMSLSLKSEPERSILLPRQNSTTVVVNTSPSHTRGGRDICFAALFFGLESDVSEEAEEIGEEPVIPDASPSQRSEMIDSDFFFFSVLRNPSPTVEFENFDFGSYQNDVTWMSSG